MQSPCTVHLDEFSGVWESLTESYVFSQTAGDRSRSSRSLGGSLKEWKKTDSRLFMTAFFVYPSRQQIVRDVNLFTPLGCLLAPPNPLPPPPRLLSFTYYIMTESKAAPVVPTPRKYISSVTHRLEDLNMGPILEQNKYGHPFLYTLSNYQPHSFCRMSSFSSSEDQVKTIENHLQFKKLPCHTDYQRVLFSFQESPKKYFSADTF